LYFVVLSDTAADEASFNYCTDIRPETYLLEGLPAPEVTREISAAEVDADIDQEIHCLALNIYFEARGEPEQGQRAVGHVVMNRVADRHYPDTVCKVVKQGGESRLNQCQFSWWCDGRSDRPINQKAWRNALQLADAIFDGDSEDPTDGALWYHADYVSPYWSNAFTLVKKIGQHNFYLHKQQPEIQSARSQDRRDS
jgi:spore germination cell wall hydrolase CwlJ-like protein